MGRRWRGCRLQPAGREGGMEQSCGELLLPRACCLEPAAGEAARAACLSKREEPPAGLLPSLLLAMHEATSSHFASVASAKQ